MKKTFPIILGVLGTIVLAMPVLAATTLYLSPSSIDVKEGQSFNVSITVDPRDINNYTAKVQLQYPADLLGLESFIFGDNWMAVFQTGYDLIDNKNGVLIKTAGFPGGVSRSITFGTASFSAKKEGNGTIKVSTDSFVLDAANQDVLGGFLDETSVTITALPPEEEIPEEEIPEEEIPEEEIIPEEMATPTPALFDILIEPVVKQVQKKPYLLVLVVILILIIVGYVLYRRKRKKLV